MPHHLQDFHGAIAFIIQIVQIQGTLIQVKYQGMSNSPFDERPIVAALVAHSLILCCLAYALLSYVTYAAESHPSWAPAPSAPSLCILTSLFSLLVLVASLTSFLLRGGLHVLPYLLLLPLFLLYLFQSLFARLYQWILCKIVAFVLFRTALPRQLPLQGRPNPAAYGR